MVVEKSPKATYVFFSWNEGRYVRNVFNENEKIMDCVFMKYEIR